MSDTTPEPRRFEPPTSPAGEGFWTATRAGRLVLPWCRACGRPHWFPREACPFCLSPELEWRESGGSGTVYAASVMPKAAMPVLAPLVPYVVVLVDLDEGVRVMSTVVGVPADSVAVGDRVQATWEPLTDGRQLLVFAPAPA